MSCSITYDTSSINSNCNGFENGKKYVLTQDVFLVKPNSKAHVSRFNKEIIIKEDKEPIALTPEGSYQQRGGLYSAPDTIEEYHNNPIGSVLFDDAYTAMHVLGVVKSGTEIEINRHKRTVGSSWWWGAVNHTNTYAKITSGEFLGNDVTVDDLGSLCRCKHTDKAIREPDENLLLLKKNSETKIITSRSTDRVQPRGKIQYFLGASVNLTLCPRDEDVRKKASKHITTNSSRWTVLLCLCLLLWCSIYFSV